MNMSARDWHGLHVFLSDPDKATGFLCEYFAPMVRTLIESGSIQAWFFLRYWEGGPHLRFRFLGLDHKQCETLRADFLEQAAYWLSGKALDRRSYYQNHPFDGKPVNVATLPWYPEGSVEAIAYLPEIQRYGGVHALAVNEMLFQVSSQIVISILASTRNAVENRLSMAFVLMAHFVCALNPDPDMIALFYRRYADYWMNYSTQTREHVERIRAKKNGIGQLKVLQNLLNSRLDKTRRRTVQVALEQAVTNWSVELRKLHELGLLKDPVTGFSTIGSTLDTSIWTMLVSQVHMTNNRLGLVPAQEAILALALTDAAQYLADSRERRADI